MTMKNHKCALCGETHGLFSIEIPPDEENGEPFDRFVCGKCWEVVAEIAFKRMTETIEKLEKRTKTLEEKHAS